MASEVMRARITRIDSDGAWVEVPDLGAGTEFGPCDVIGGTVDALAVGQVVVAVTLGGVQEDLAVVGSGGTDPAVIAAIEAAIAANTEAIAANDALAVHKAGAETVTGAKRFDLPLNLTELSATPAAVAGDAKFYYRSGKLMVATAGGERVVPFELPQVARALHLNPDLEEGTIGSAPVAWDAFWGSGTGTGPPSAAALANDQAYSGTKSFKAILGTSGYIIMETGVFDVVPGQRIRWEIAGRCSTSQGRVGYEAMMGATAGQAAYFGGGPQLNLGLFVPPSGAWARDVIEFTVPPGMYFMRMAHRVTSNDNTPLSLWLDASWSQVVNAGTGGGVIDLPIGTVEEFAGATVPPGYLLCDGSAVSRTTFGDLFAVIGTTYGVGDGSTTFNLPGRSYGTRGAAVERVVKEWKTSGIGSYATATPGATTGTLLAVPGAGRLKGVVHATGYASSSVAIVVDVYLDGVKLGECRMNTVHPLINAHGALSEFVFDVPITQGNHYLALRQSGGVSDFGDIWSHEVAAIVPDMVTRPIIKATRGAGGGPGAGYAATTPALTAGVWTNVVHSLGSENIIPSVKDTTTKEGVDVDWKVVDANTIALRSLVAGYSAGALTLVVKA